LKITLVNKKIEDIGDDEIEKVDLIISEPLGIMLVNERMLEGYIYARDRYL
jgi:histone-arginine methyltransferase CARM1